MPRAVAGGQSLSCQLGRDPAHVRHARERARKALCDWGLGEHADLAALVVSELVTNAICHGAGTSWMGVSHSGGVLRVEVHDGGAGRPVRRHAGEGDDCGRGLEVLDGLIELHGGERGVISDPCGPGKTVYVVLSLETTLAGARLSGAAGCGTQRGLDAGPVIGPACYGCSRSVPEAPAAGGQLRTCPHLPPCPPPQARDCLAARVVARHPEQGWSLLCNGVVAFEDTGALLPDRSVIEPDRGAWQAGANGVTQAERGRTVAPVPAGGAREGGPRRPVPVMAGAALVASLSGTGPGWRQHAARLPAWRVPAQAVPPARGLQEKVAPGAW